MNIVILGSGGREHALCKKIYLSKKVKKIYSIPGNAGTSDISENINLPLNDFSRIEKFIKDKNIDLIVVGPEQPLVDGVVDYFENKNINIFGPNKIASQLEGSKIFTKKLCEKYNIPSANFGIFEDVEKALNFLSKANFPLVIKARANAIRRLMPSDKRQPLSNIGVSTPDSLSSTNRRNPTASIIWLSRSEPADGLLTKIFSPIVPPISAGS